MVSRAFLFVLYLFCMHDCIVLSCIVLYLLDPLENETIRLKGISFLNKGSYLGQWFPKWVRGPLGDGVLEGVPEPY